ncbi:MAG: hypothetical protein FWC55_05435 [Firmicutes bacterium]|nr:hypothetical protein [Bacillota bacterium]
MMELDPKYAGVIVRRYASFVENDGADISVERGGVAYGYADIAEEAVD